MANTPDIVILGAGPAGLGAAFRLTREGRAHVTVLEQNACVGGNAGSFELAGIKVDYGSHRLHPSCAPEILADIRALLGDDLLDRPRHGRIRLCDRWIHFPLKPFDLALGLPLHFSTGVTADLLRRAMGSRNGSQRETFASVLGQSLGRTICDNFYFPYVQKIWGLRPEELAVTLARKRISAGSLSKMARKILGAVSGFKNNGRGRFYYPGNGYGQISEAYCRAVRGAGADVYLGARVKAVVMENNAVKAVHYEQHGRMAALRADHVWSTIPVTVLAKCLQPGAPGEILQAAAAIDYRAMILVYLVLKQERFSEFDAHYFPETRIPISRLSEPKNYSNGRGPDGVTVLCAELPCGVDAPEWAMDDRELGRLTCGALEMAGIPVRVPVLQVVTRRLRQAYPIYQQGYERHFECLDAWLSRIDGLVSFGRQGLFAHDNTHHALYMAYAAVDCLDDNADFDRQRWQRYREEFESHVVED